MTPTRRRFLLSSAALAAAPAFAAAANASPKMRLGLVTYNVARDWDLPTILRICQAAGIEAVECRTTHKHGVEPSLSRAERDTIRRQFLDSGVTFWGPGTTCHFHAPDPQSVKDNIELAKQFLQLAKDLGGMAIKVRPNALVKGQSVDQSCDQIGRALRECGRAAADLGLEVCCEVHGQVTQLPENMKKILDACDHPAVGVTWNSNPTDLVDGSIAGSFDLLAPHIRACHINDLENDARGTYPYRDLFRRLSAIGYDRFTMIEMPEPVPVEEGVAWLERYKRSWAELVRAG